jgi:hypothetical protein
MREGIEGGRRIDPLIHRFIDSMKKWINGSILLPPLLHGQFIFCIVTETMGESPAVRL